VFRPTINFKTVAYSSCSAHQESVLKEYNVNVEVLKQTNKNAVRKLTTELLPILATLYLKFKTPHYTGVILTEESPC
jgi:hypothetical protein